MSLKRKLFCTGCKTDFSAQPECNKGWFLNHHFSCLFLRIEIPVPSPRPPLSPPTTPQGSTEDDPAPDDFQLEEHREEEVAVIEPEKEEQIEEAEEENLPTTPRNIRRKFLKVKRKSDVFLPRALPSVATQTAMEYFGTDEKFNVILADPPWRYETSRVGRFGCAEHHYDTMAIEDIWAMPVRELAADDAMCLIWATGPKFPEAVLTMQHWGFDYKTIFFVWEKTTRSGEPIKNGISNYTRSCTEFVIVGTKPKTKLRNIAHPERKKRIQQLIREPRTEHSRKPLEAIKRIDAFCLDELKKIELFAREAKGPTWAIWGNELDKFEEGDDVE
jgi:N6-adenosine-specific RNA methylase IME4